MPARRSLVLVPALAALVGLGCVSAPRRADSAPTSAPAVTASSAGPDEAGSGTDGSGTDGSGTDGSGTDGSGTDGSGTDGSSTDGSSTDGTDTPAEFAQDLASAQRIAETYWRGRFSASGIQFQPISRLIPYQRAGEVDCGGQPLGLNNAAYCSAGDFIAYDVNWAFGAFRQIGDAFIFYLLGHEYAHGIQLRLGIQKQFTIQQELQADCMAGAYIGDSVRDKQLQLQDGDIDELRRGLDAVGDAPGQPWFAEGSHGSAEQRTQSFANGFDDSLDACGVQ